MRIARLPAQDDPVVQRMERVRERDYALVDTLNEHYSNFGESIDVAYSNWRRYSHEELEAEAEAKRKAMTRQLLGAAAIIGGVVAGSNSSSSAGSAASTAAVIGGIYAFKSGYEMRSEVKMHGESLKQLGNSFQNEVQPSVVDIEGRTLELKGSAEQQYAEWRRLLRELYEDETGLPAAAPAAAATAPAVRSPEQHAMILRTTLTSGQVLAARYELVRALATGHDQATWLARDLRQRAKSCCGCGARATPAHRDPPSITRPCRHRTRHCATAKWPSTSSITCRVGRSAGCAAGPGRWSCSACCR